VWTKDPTIDASAATMNETTIDTGAAIATNRNLTEKDTTIDTSAAATKDTTIDTNAAIIATTTNVTSDIDERKSPYRIPKKAKTTMPDNNNAATMTGTPIGATSPTGSVADHDSSKSQTTKGNKKVSIIYDMFLFPKWN
jgi:prolyl-tRNA editing enzyme YbaK/EbsC (Cys-tRNA(Pro) deacylase)